MRVEKRRESLGAQERSVPGNHNRELRTFANGAPRDLHGVPGPPLRLLQNGLRTKGGYDRANFLSLVAHDDQ